MKFRLRRAGSSGLLFAVVATALTACGGGGGSGVQPAVATQPVVTQPVGTQTGPPLSATIQSTVSALTVSRKNLVGAFFRPQGAPPFGVFSNASSMIAPEPYPTPSTVLIGSNSYCDQAAANGASIDSAYVVDSRKLSNIINLGVRWTRLTAPQFTTDFSHIFGPGRYAFAGLDAAQCVSLGYHGIVPVIDLEAGPVEYNADPNAFSPAAVTVYKTAADFGEWCGVVAAHEKAVFPAVHQFSAPGNEVNSNPDFFPGGEPQIAAYTRSCYAAIKASNPTAFVYGFELNMDGNLNPAAFVRRMVGLGCGVGTCYDGISMHLALTYPTPPASAPCHPNSGGTYSMQCIADIRAAAQSPSMHVLISETVYNVPASVPDEQTKAEAVVSEFAAFSQDTGIDGVSYANVDDCSLYPIGYFSGGCLIDVSGTTLPAYGALQWLASMRFL